MVAPRTKSTKRSFCFTEKQMADAFERLLRDGRPLPGLGSFARVFREVDCQRGRPDFIALARGTGRFFSGKGIALKFAGSLVLSFLHNCAPRSAKYLQGHTGLTYRTVQAAIHELLNSRYVLRTGNGAYVLNPGRPLRQVQVWAFELKLGKPKRAVFQAQQYRSFAQRVLIVVPPGQMAVYSKFRVAMRRWGIGLATFDPIRSEFLIRRLPRPSQPHSKQHQAYALFQLLQAASSN